MSVQDIVNSEGVKSVIESSRSMCFWSFPEDFMPKDKDQLLLALDCLERYGDRNAYCKAGEIREVVFHEGTIGGAWPTIIDQ